jgi:hypothetical protein
MYVSLSDIAPADTNASAPIVDVEKLQQNLSEMEARW